mmetsp:Transcript_22861/g.75805  ORF Transcript_22861/g.75805 Transcript_22861/m.75805 type:complete len:471 (+) Transcript_22861:944-2356(+)
MGAGEPVMVKAEAVHAGGTRELSLLLAREPPLVHQIVVTEPAVLDRKRFECVVVFDGLQQCPLREAFAPEPVVLLELVVLRKVHGDDLGRRRELLYEMPTRLDVRGEHPLQDVLGAAVTTVAVRHAIVDAPVQNFRQRNRRDADPEHGASDDDQVVVREFFALWVQDLVELVHLVDGLIVEGVRRPATRGLVPAVLLDNVRENVADRGFGAERRAEGRQHVHLRAHREIVQRRMHLLPGSAQGLDGAFPPDVVLLRVQLEDEVVLFAEVFHEPQLEQELADVGAMVRDDAADEHADAVYPLELLQGDQRVPKVREVHVNLGVHLLRCLSDVHGALVHVLPETGVAQLQEHGNAGDIREGGADVLAPIIKMIFMSAERATIFGRHACLAAKPAPVRWLPAAPVAALHFLAVHRAEDASAALAHPHAPAGAAKAFAACAGYCAALLLHKLATGLIDIVLLRCSKPTVWAGLH